VSEPNLMQVYDWWKINSWWLEKYIREDDHTVWGEEDRVMIDVISSLIENGPEVDEEFIVEARKKLRYALECYPEGTLDEQVDSLLVSILREAGVRVKEGK